MLSVKVIKDLLSAVATASKVDLEDLGKVLDLIHEYPESEHILLFSDSSECLFDNNVFDSIASILDNYKESFEVCLKAVTAINNLINASTASKIKILKFTDRLTLANALFSIATIYKKNSKFSEKVSNIYIVKYLPVNTLVKYFILHIIGQADRIIGLLNFLKGHSQVSNRIYINISINNYMCVCINIIY